VPLCPQWFDLGLNPVLRVQGPATNRLEIEYAVVTSLLGFTQMTGSPRNISHGHQCCIKRISCGVGRLYQNVHMAVLG
jgi:hypothetical protein